jgi:hypothetical protein
MAVAGKIELQCWKEHPCIYCGARYRYLLKKSRKVKGQPDAQTKYAVESALAESMKREVSPVACPECGALQPDMIRARKLPIVALLLLVAGVVFVLEVIFPLAGTLGDQALVYFCGGLAVAVAVTAGVFGLSDANRDLEGNRSRSLRALDEGQVQVGPPAEPMPAPPAFRGRLLRWPAWLGLVGGALLPFMAEVLRARMEWPVNSGWSPQVIGPGNYAWTRFPSSGLESVKANWRANSVAATVLNSREVGLPSGVLQADSREQNWGDSISVKAGEKSQGFRPWCGFYVPADPQLAGKRIRVKMDLVVLFPALRGENTYDNVTQPVSHTATFVLSSSGAGTVYRMIWAVTGGLGVGLISLILGLALLRLHRLKDLSPPAATLPADTDRPEGAPSKVLDT